MLEHDWLLTALIYGLIGYFRSKLSDLTSPITNINCVNNEMLERDWLLTAPIYALIGCFRSKLFDWTCPITNICNNWSGQIKQLSSQ